MVLKLGYHFAALECIMAIVFFLECQIYFEAYTEVNFKN
jgi:uncharacterized membrane protein